MLILRFAVAAHVGRPLSLRVDERVDSRGSYKIELRRSPNYVEVLSALLDMLATIPRITTGRNSTIISAAGYATAINMIAREIKIFVFGNIDVTLEAARAIVSVEETRRDRSLDPTLCRTKKLRDLQARLGLNHVVEASNLSDT